MEKILLSISLLVSNRIDTIRKCMESLKPILDAIPSELIAIDTVEEGCSDGSIGVVAEYTDKIYKFKWINDFSAARNVGLKHATGEWFMFIDDDEWFEDATEIIEFFKSGEYKNYGSANYKVRNYYTYAGNNYLDSYAGRMSRRTKELHFESRVHEYFTPSYMPLKYFQCYAHHYGYVFENEKKKKEHTQRNMQLLMDDIKENPHDVRLINQLAQEYLIDNEYDKVMDACNQVLTAFKKNTASPYVQYMITLKVRALNNQRKWREAFETAELHAKEYSLSKRSEIILDVERVIAANNDADKEGVLKYADGYFEKLDEYTKNRDVFKNQLVMDDITYVSESMQNKVALLAGRNAVDLKKYAKAFEYIKRIRWEQNAYIDAAVELLFGYINESKDADGFAAISAEAVCDKRVLEVYPEYLEKISAKNTELFVQICGCLSKYKLQGNYFNYLRVCYHLYMKNAKELLSELDEVFKVSGSIYEADIVARLVKNSFGMTYALKYADMDAFRAGMISAAKDSATDDLLKHIEEMKSLFCDYPEKYAFARMLLLEEKILSCSGDSVRVEGGNIIREAAQVDYEEMLQLLYDYSVTNRDFAELMYDCDVKNLPGSCRFALAYLKAEAEHENGNIKESLRLKKEAAREYAPMIKPVQALIAAYSKQLEEQKAAEDSSKLEMKLLAAQIKKNIYTLLDSGNGKGALELITALYEFVPDDRELEQLKKEAESKL